MQEKHRDFYLFHSESRGFEKRINDAKDVIDKMLSMSGINPYLAFSGGKDSTLMLALFAEVGATKVPVFTQLDDMDWDFTHEHCQNVSKTLGFDNHHFVKTDYSVKQRVLSNQKIDTDVCFFDEVEVFVQKHGFNAASIGIRIEESKRRKVSIAKNGRLFEQVNGFVKCSPLGFLLGVDVFAYIISRNLPYAETYDKCGELWPHQMRFSWMVHPDFFTKGNMLWLKRYYPEKYYELCRMNPYFRCYV